MIQLTARQTPAQGQWTLADWEALPQDGHKYEIIDGNLHVTPPPGLEHQDAAAELLLRMRLHAKTHGLGKVVAAPVGVRIPGQPVPLEPDILFVSTQRQNILATKQYVEGAPDLIVEIISPSSATYDRKKKFKVYEAGGVQEYWIVDCRAKTVDLFVLENQRYAQTGQYGLGQTVTSQALAGFSVKVDDIFAS